MTPYSIRFWPNAEEGQGFNGSNDRRVLRIRMGATSVTRVTPAGLFTATRLQSLLLIFFRKEVLCYFGQ
jgi:hypothetical protein